MPSAKSATARKKSATAAAAKRGSTPPRVKVIAVPTNAFQSPQASTVRYSVHPGILKLQKWIAELKSKTGRSVDEWTKHIRAAGPSDERQARKWLQDQYTLGTNSAWWLAERAFGNVMGMADNTPEGYLAAAPQYVDLIYSGSRQALRPLHDKLIELAQSLDGIRICPCKSMVSLYHKHVFAEIKPASISRIALGFALQDEPFTARLRDTGVSAKKSRITHQVVISKIADIDLQVRRWLKQAFEHDA